MRRVALFAAGPLLAGTSARVTDAFQTFVSSERLPMDFEGVTRSKLGQAALVVLSNGTSTYDDTPAVQRSLGLSRPDGIFWSCKAAAAETKAN